MFFPPYPCLLQVQPPLTEDEDEPHKNRPVEVDDVVGGSALVEEPCEAVDCLLQLLVLQHRPQLGVGQQAGEQIWAEN